MAAMTGYLERDEAAKRIRQALKRRSGKLYWGTLYWGTLYWGTRKYPLSPDSGACDHPSPQLVAHGYGEIYTVPPTCVLHPTLTPYPLWATTAPPVPAKMTKASSALHINRIFPSFWGLAP